MTKYITLVLSSLLFLSPAAQADEVFSIPANIRQLELQLQGDQSQLDLSASDILLTLIAPDCNLTGVTVSEEATEILDLDLSLNSLAVVPRLSVAKNIRVVNFDHCFMTEANVDQILADLVESQSTSIEADLRGNAAPSSEGLANIAIIESRGGTVLID